ncbi:hypothetical protein [Bacillus sp. CBEL-1]|uniref:hypothetical protein n=1 Tax=Bacillus sp. CBEL-1 TaxID=2502980 RepID=UPI0010444FD9|nr:hypothetical protein [Bacillus sp. CBEL-1]TDB49582.1 hypothetical protein EPL02_10750 [Bacillus sp. CBEL-1]
MTVTRMFNPVLALIIFGVGIWMASIIHPLFGLIAILGGALLGFSSLSRSGITLKKNANVLLFASFVFLVSLFSIAYLVASAVILNV